MTFQYLDKLYDDLQKEQQQLLANLKNQTDERTSKEREITRLISLLNTTSLNVLKIKTLKKKLLVE
jgi:hypothetical protein